MPLKSGNYGSIKRGRNSEPLKSHTDAEESGKYSPLSPGSGGACKDCSPLVPHVIETGDSGQRRGAVSASLVLLFCFLGGGLGLAFSVHKGTKYSDFSTASEDSPLSYESLDDQTNAMMNSCLIEVSRLAFLLVVNIILANVESKGGISSSHIRCCCCCTF